MDVARKSKRVQILEAAALIVYEKGVDALTLDAVGKRAGVSKGGLLYHFKSKDGLIEALVQYANHLYQDNVENALDMSLSQGRYLNALIEATRTHRAEHAPITSGLLAAHGTNKDHLAPLKASYVQWQSTIINEGVDPVDATIMRLAIDGLWLSEIFEFSAIDETMREAVLNRLKAYTQRETVFDHDNN